MRKRKVVKKSRVSCTRLSQILRDTLSDLGVEFCPADLSPAQLRSMCEAYGRDVRCYFYLSDLKTAVPRERLERELKKRGVKVYEDYAPGQAIIEIAVTYFKAWHWNE